MKILAFWKKSLLVQIVGSFSALSFTIVGLTGYLAFVRARDSLKQSIFERLTAVASLKEEELDRWLLDRRNILLSLIQLPEIEAQAKILLSAGRSTPEYQLAAVELQTALEGFIRDRSDYREIFLLSRGGRVLASTESEKIGNYQPLMGGSEAIEGDAENFTGNFYRSQDSDRPDRPALTITTPIFDEAGKRMGLLAVHLNLERLDRIIRDNRGLGRTGETYAIVDLGNGLIRRYAFVSAEEFGSQEFPDGVESEGISSAMAGRDDRGLYRNYRNIPVIGAYHWLGRHDLALLVEMEQTEAFAPARRLAYEIVLAGLSLSGILAVAMVLAGRQIVKPILAIATAARALGGKVQGGNFADLQPAPVLTENEIGFLAKTFNQMLQKLQSSYEQLQEYSHDLESKVAARTRELQDKNEDLQETLNKLERTQLQLIQNEKMASLGQMVAGIAHEINNPVSFIAGNLKYLQEYATALLDLIALYQTEYPEDTAAIAEEKETIDLEFVQSDLPKMLSSIKIGTTRIREIVISLRNFSRLDESDRKAVDLHEGIDSTILILQNRLKAAPNRPEIKIVKEYATLPEIECYPSQLNQVFLNIISNAIDALETRAIAGEIAEPSIRICTQLKEKQAVIAIADNGPGIPEETRHKIFDPFFTTKEIGKGTGLGLSISYSIVVERHGGQLTCISSPGQGTEFIASIPLEESDR
ncbi:MAG: ATP-binding protein [Cyanobacteria bacterium P01_E01_bin.42]